MEGRIARLQTAGNDLVETEILGPWVSERRAPKPCPRPGGKRQRGCQWPLSADPPFLAVRSNARDLPPGAVFRLPGTCPREASFAESPWCPTPSGCSVLLRCQKYLHFIRLLERLFCWRQDFRLTVTFSLGNMSPASPGTYWCR